MAHHKPTTIIPSAKGTSRRKTPSNSQRQGNARSALLQPSGYERAVRDKADERKQVGQRAHSMEFVKLALQLFVHRRVLESTVVPLVALEHDFGGLRLEVEHVSQGENQRRQGRAAGNAQPAAREDHHSRAERSQLEVLREELRLKFA